MKKEILRLQDVTYKKQNTIIFRNMTFNILKGEIMGFIPMNSYSALKENFDYFVENNELIKSMETFDFNGIKPLLINGGIVVGFSVVFIILTNLVSRKKQVVG